MEMYECIADYLLIYYGMSHFFTFFFSTLFYNGFYLQVIFCNNIINNK